MEIKWRWHTFQDLSGRDVHDMLMLRQEIFIVEQKCIYQDADQFDLVALHLYGCTNDNTLAVYARVLPPGTRFKEPSIGRLSTNKHYRQLGLAKEAVTRAVQKCQNEYGPHGIKISAQLHLMNYYVKIGFSPVGSAYDEDGILHIDMVVCDKRM